MRPNLDKASSPMIGKVPAKRVLAQLQQSPPRPYEPHEPGISFGKALWLRNISLKQKRDRRIKPRKCEPWQAHFCPEKLESNMWARLLGGSPRMDSLTKLVLPSTLLLRIGVIDSKLLGAVSGLDQHLSGPRSYVSGNCVGLPNEAISKIYARYPEIRKIPKDPNFEIASREVLRSEIEKLYKAYKPRGPKVCELINNGKRIEVDRSGQVVLNISDLGLCIPAPSEITVGLGGRGIRLAGALYKLCYLCEHTGQKKAL